jgi:hypothetical protein
MSLSMVFNLWIGQGIIFESGSQFLILNSHFPVTTLGLGLFSGAYLKLVFLWCPETEKSLFNGSHRLGASLPEDRYSQSKTSHFFKKLGKWTKSKKKIISFTFSGGLLSTIGDVGLGLALHGPIWHGPVLSFIHEFKMTSYIQAPN